jgi:hypothetical protein
MKKQIKQILREGMLKNSLGVAIKFCDNNGLKYKLVDVGILNDNKIKKLYNDSKIKFLPKYEEKFKIKIKKDEKQN